MRRPRRSPAGAGRRTFGCSWSERTRLLRPTWPRRRRRLRKPGIRAETIVLPADISPDALLAEIDRANRSPEIDGILVQLPLPPGHDSARVFDAVDPRKDVDGFHPENVGRLRQGRPRPGRRARPPDVMELLERSRIELEGAPAVVMGRSDIVGKPVAALLTAADATVTICHSQDPGAAPPCAANAEMLVAAMGDRRSSRANSWDRGRRGDRRRDQPAPLRWKRRRRDPSGARREDAAGSSRTAGDPSWATSTSTTWHPRPGGSRPCREEWAR